MIIMSTEALIVDGVGPGLLELASALVQTAFHSITGAAVGHADPRCWARKTIQDDRGADGAGDVDQPFAVSLFPSSPLPLSAVPPPELP
jgi:hypothetical protein